MSGIPSPNRLRTAGLVESGRSSGSSLLWSSISFCEHLDQPRLADLLQVIPAPVVRSPSFKECFATSRIGGAAGS